MSLNEFIVKDITTVGKFIKNQRKEMDVTQDDLANFAGLSRVGVVKLEKEAGDIKLSTLLKVANLLGFEIVLKKRSNK
jgi:DNA-binding XRE family transcriptional regulator